MSQDRWTSLDLAEYQSRREAACAGGRVEPRCDYKAELLQQFALVGIRVEPEFKFAPPRKWSADWRVIGTRVLVEFEGGLFKKGKGGHSSVGGILRDIEKYNAAALAGYTVIRVAPNHVRSGQALQWVENAIQKMLDDLASAILRGLKT